MINKNFDKKQIERSFRISLVDMGIKSNHSSEYHAYSEKEKGSYHFSYYRGLASLYADQKFERIRLYLKACIQSVNKDDLNEYDQIFNSVKEFICQEFEDIEQDLKIELSIELKDKYDSLQIPGKVEEQFNSRELKLKEILYHKMDGIMRYVKDKLTAESEIERDYTRVLDWEKMTVYLKKSDISYIKFEYLPNHYENDKISTNQLKAGNVKFTGAKDKKNQPYKIMESFIKSDMIRRHPDDEKDNDISKSVSRLNGFFTDNFNKTFKRNNNPITSVKDKIYNYTSKIKFKYI